MVRRFIQDYINGDTLDEIFLVADKQIRANRNGSLYLLVELRDKSGMISARMWNITEQAVASIIAGEFAHARGKVQLYQGD